MNKAELLRRHPYVRIKVAAHEGRGVRLTPDEVWTTANDAAIATAAVLEAERAGWTWDESGALVPLKES